MQFLGYQLRIGVWSWFVLGLKHAVNQRINLLWALKITSIIFKFTCSWPDYLRPFNYYWLIYTSQHLIFKSRISNCNLLKLYLATSILPIKIYCKSSNQINQTFFCFFRFSHLVSIQMRHNKNENLIKISDFTLDKKILVVKSERIRVN